MMLVPLLKGLTLGDIKIQLVEFYSYVGNVPPMHQAERVIASKKIPKPDPDAFNMDKWEIETFYESQQVYPNVVKMLIYNCT